MVIYLKFFITITKHTEMYMVEKLANADALYVPYGRLDIRKNCVRIYGADVWNSIPPCIQKSESVTIFKHRLRCYLIDRKLMV